MDLVDLNQSISVMLTEQNCRDPYGSRGSKYKALLLLPSYKKVEILMDLVDLNS